MKFVVQPSDGDLVALMRGPGHCSFGIEDFGMIAIEAMACGTPVVALGAGGARDFIQPGVNGQFFDTSRPRV